MPNHHARYFNPDPSQRQLAQDLYNRVAHLPLICPHGHVDPRVFADPDYAFGTPTDLFIIPDHYIFRMLYAQGIPLERLGVPRVDGGATETDHRKIWQIFADHFYLFRGTPTGMWITDELRDVFGIDTRLTGQTAQAIYDQIAEKLTTPAFRPRALYERFNIEVLCTTDAATDTLAHHQAIRESGWQGRILPTFRPDAVINIQTAGWRQNIDTLSAVSGIIVDSYPSFIQALEQRRSFFKAMGAKATDHAAQTAYTEVLSPAEAGQIFQQALSDQWDLQAAMRFTGHMLIEMARMSTEDGLVMQLHTGSLRNHNRQIYERFGLDKGADIPIQGEFTRNLQPLLEQFGNDPRLTLILFTLDETTYGRELAPLAGHYPALKLGPPWWFYDSFNGMRRYFDQVMETAGLYNTVGFNDDTRAFPSIPVRHDLWRRAAADWIAGLLARGMVDQDDAAAMIVDCAYNLAKQAYRIGESTA
ncbi:MAG: glucuronate isomerase [Anaerolineae bacterium]|nr:glucuronate isomerase [Anaerolineae bacterium]